MKKRLMTLMLLTGTLTMQAQQPVYLDESQPIEQRVEDALSRMTLDEKIRVIHAQSKFSSPGVPRLGFPDFWTDDGPHGVRPDVLWDEWEQAGQTNDSCVAFPALTCLAATWNPTMARHYGETLGEEALYRGKNMILGPGVNIYRTPLNGRNFEYMGEDPYLASRMVVPYVQGLQSKGVSACVKHYALNNDEEFRHQVNVIVSDRALHEIYLPAFKAAVQEGQAWGIMGAYNLYKGQHNCHNDIMLNQILKRDWQFDGVVVSDWGGCHDTDEAIRNGLDMEFGSWTDGLTMGATNAYDRYFLADAYKQGIREGKYTTKELDEKVRRILRLFFRTTMNRQRPTGFLCSDAHYATARQIAGEGIVLLKNEKLKIKNEKSGKGQEVSEPLLPLTLEKLQRIHASRHPSLREGQGVGSLLVVGENAIKPMTVGGGSSSLKVQREITPLDGLRKQFSILNSQFSISYARGYVGDTTSYYNGVKMPVDLTEYRSEQELLDEAVSKAKEVDVVLFFGGLNKDEFQDSEGHDRRDYALPYGQDALITALAKANPNLVYINISGNAVATPWIDRVPAMVQGWYLGSEAGEALADVLTGRVNPSGKLPYTWYKKLDDTGAHALDTYPGTWREGGQIIDEEYKEGIYVGYRWADKQKIKPTFAFGHGLSYTTFQLSNLQVTPHHPSPTTQHPTWTTSVTVTNTGDKAGAEVVQLYIHDKKSSVDRPEKELKGFQKVFLQPGESQTVTISFDEQALSFYDEAMHQWRWEPGDFEVLVGNSSDRLTLRTTLKVAE